MAVAGSNIEDRLTCTVVYILRSSSMAHSFLEFASNGCNCCKLPTAHNDLCNYVTEATI